MVKHALHIVKDICRRDAPFRIRLVRETDDLLPKPLKRLPGKLGDLRIGPGGGFSKLLDSSRDISFGGQNAGEIQMRAGEFGLQPDRFAVFMRSLGQLPLSSQQSAQQFMRLGHIRVGAQGCTHRIPRFIEPIDRREFQRIVVAPATAAPEASVTFPTIDPKRTWA
jgi:hypothetical protein